MRICIVGCGAVGSLFAANLARLDDVEVWAYDARTASTWTRSTRDGLRLSGAGEVVGHPRATADPAELPPCDFGIVATKAMHTERGDRGDGARVRGRLRRDGAERDRQRGGDRGVRREGDPRDDVPRREAPRARPRAVGRQGRHDARPVRAAPAPFAEVERLADACTRAGMPTKAVADARGPQWRKVIFNASTNPVGALTGLTHGRVCERPDLRRARLRPRRRGQGGRGRAGHRARRRPGGPHRPRGEARGRVRPQGVDAPGRRGAPHDGDRLPQRRYRPLRARARGADAVEPGDLGTRERGGAVVDEMTAGTRTSALRSSAAASTPRSSAARSTRASKGP